YSVALQKHSALSLARHPAPILAPSAYKLLPLQERSIYFLAPESDGAVFRLHSNIVVSSLRWRNDLSLSEKTINVSRWGTISESAREIPYFLASGNLSKFARRYSTAFLCFFNWI